MTLVACIGGGQLGRMLAIAGLPLGLRFRFLDPASDACAGEVGELLVGVYEDTGLLDRLADGADVVTFEFENVPVAAARARRRAPGAPRARSSGRTASPRRSCSGGWGSRPHGSARSRTPACPRS